jgi:hypothetical protein
MNDRRPPGQACDASARGAARRLPQFADLPARIEASDSEMVGHTRHYRECAIPRRADVLGAREAGRAAAKRAP